MGILGTLKIKKCVKKAIKSLKKKLQPSLKSPLVPFTHLGYYNDLILLCLHFTLRRSFAFHYNPLNIIINYKNNNNNACLYMKL